MKKKDWMNLSQVLMALSVVAIILAGIGYLGTDIWLASTQWMITAAVLALFGIYSRISSR